MQLLAGTLPFMTWHYIYCALSDRDCELARTLNSLVRVSRRVGHICAAVIASCSIHLHTVCKYANTCIVNCIGKPSSCFRFRTSALAQQRPRSPKPQLITSCVCISRAEHVSPHVLQDTSVSVQVYPWSVTVPVLCVVRTVVYSVLCTSQEKSWPKTFRKYVKKKQKMQKHCIYNVKRRKIQNVYAKKGEKL